MIKTLKVRIKDKHARLLREMAIEVNTVWNYCNELSYRMITERHRWLSPYDLDKYIKGASEEFNSINYSAIQATAHEYASKRNQFKKSRLRWRKSFGVNRSLGWVPFKSRDCSYKNGQVRFARKFFSIWDSHGLSQYRFRAGCFTEDARGRWYLCVAVEAPDIPTTGQDRIGIDLGLKTVATCSDGTRLDGKWYRDLEPKLAKAQRARNKKQARNIHAKIANRRKDALHKFSRELVNRCGEIYVGDVSSSKLIKTKMAKSTHDAGWASLKTMLSYKSQQAGIVYKEINEAFTTQVCSSCGCMPETRPKGIADLGIRHWECCECGSLHDRDINSAINILNVGSGHGPLVEEIAA